KISASIKEKEKRLAEIQVLKKHIFDYFKTKDVYADYRKCGYSKRFLEEQNTISTSSLKVTKNRKRNVSENTISLDYSMWGICRFKTYGFPLFSFLKQIPTEENSDS
ncbi:MAG: hypothetical protein K6G14_00660, partial [Eubacterium sp.]|nr:hypothetical protein [Eubacterium sp.]